MDNNTRNKRIDYLNGRIKEGKEVIKDLDKQIADHEQIRKTVAFVVEDYEMDLQAILKS